MKGKYQVCPLLLKSVTVTVIKREILARENLGARKVDDRVIRLPAYLNPMTWQVHLLKFSLLGIGSPKALVLEGIALALFTTLCLIPAVRSLHRAA